jgi:hypothetical protein
MAINVVAEDFMGTSFPMYGILGAMTWLVDTAEIVAGGTTGFSGSQTIDDPDVGLVTIAANVTGTDIEYNELGGITYVSGGILEALTYTVTVPGLGTVTLFEASNGNFDAADLVAARLAELEGNATAIEDFFMGFDYNFTLGSEDEDVPVGSLFGDDLAEWNLRGDDVVYAGDGKDRSFWATAMTAGMAKKVATRCKAAMAKTSYMAARVATRSKAAKEPIVYLMAKGLTRLLVVVAMTALSLKTIPNLLEPAIQIPSLNSKMAATRFTLVVLMRIRTLVGMMISSLLAVPDLETRRAS